MRSMSYENFDSVKWIKSSSAGDGYAGLKGDAENYDIAKRTALTIAEKLDRDRYFGPEAIKQSTPDIALTRTQLSQIKAMTKRLGRSISLRDSGRLVCGSINGCV